MARSGDTATAAKGRPIWSRVEDSLGQGFAIKYQRIKKQISSANTCDNMQFQEILFKFVLRMIFSSFFLYSIWQIVVDIYLANKSKTWATIEGKIIESKTEKQHRGRQSPSYFAHIEYVYEVDGQQYKGSRISFGAIWGLKGIAQRHRRRYREGRKILVYYNPNKPSIATLETELPFETYFLLLFLSIFVLLIMLAAF